MTHDLLWTEPPPLWPSPGAAFVPERAGAFARPALLRFTSDAFMDDFLDVLAAEPHRLGAFRARPETWRGFTPPPVPAPRRPPSAVLERLGLVRRDRTARPHRVPDAPPPAPGVPLKLYQPVHGRHYLVVSSLVCRVPGLPDRAVDAARSERAGFVMRRLLPPPGAPDAPPAQWEEHAWVPGGRGRVWRRLADADALADGEEVLPMFGVALDGPPEGPRRRRVHAGSVPAGRREAYLAAPRTASADAATPGVTPRTARKVLLRREVAEPWKSLLVRADRVRRALVGPFTGDDRPPTAAERRALLETERAGLQTVSWLVLLDLARFLAAHLPDVWAAVLDPGRRDRLTSARAAVLDALGAAVLSDALRDAVRHGPPGPHGPTVLYGRAAVPATLRGALARFGVPPDGVDPGLERLLETQDAPYARATAAGRAGWPPFLFPLADPEHPDGAPLPPLLDLGGLTEAERDLGVDEGTAVDPALARVDRLAALIVRALGDDDGAPAPDVPAAAVAPADGLAGRFCIRCVLERPACAPLRAAVVSPPTEPFLLAGFFDPDAPARPIRIGLPVDTTPAGLRRFDRNTALVISDTLCGQIRRLKGLSLGDLVRSVLPWPLHKDLPVDDGGACRTGGGDALGMICSVSIPIITICALVLLMIMVTLLDLVFRWVPYFIMCFPVPGLKAKPDAP